MFDIIYSFVVFFLNLYQDDKFSRSTTDRFHHRYTFLSVSRNSLIYQLRNAT